MHVLQLLPTLEVGGVERGVLDLTKGLIARGHQVSVVSSGGPLVERLIQAGAVPYQAPVHAKSPATMWSCVPVVADLIRSRGIDLVHARSRVPAWIGLFASRRAQRPFITTAHGFYRPHLASRVMVWGRLVIAPSETLGRYLMDTFGLPRQRLRVIPRGVDLAEFPFSPPPSTPATWRIGLFGRLSRIKGHETALRAVARLRRQGVPVVLRLAGEAQAPQAARLAPLIHALKLQDAVEWVGATQDMADVLAGVDLVVVPSVYPESFGRAVVEAQAVGRPVVASRLGALPELIEDARTGLLVPPANAEALAEALRRFIDDPTLRQRCVTEARRRVEAQWTVERMIERTLAVYEESLAKPRVLVWKLSALGDVVLSTPSLRAIRRQFPQGAITLLVGRAAYHVVARCPHVDEIVLYDPKGKDRWLRRRLAFLRQLWRTGYDVSIDLQNSRNTHLMAWLAGVPVRIGYRRKLGWLLNRGVRLPRVVLAPIAHQHQLLRSAGIAPDGERLELWPSPQEDEAAGRLLPDRSGARGVVGLHPGGSGRWKTKRWDLQRWARLCDALAERDIRVVVTGGPDERVLGDALARLTTSRPISLIGRTNLMELACLIRRFDVFVAHDSSPLHLAAAMGTPTVALFGPTDPARHLPPAFRGQVVKKDVFCSPCYSPRCRTITHACMQQIGVPEVLNAVLNLLDEPAAVPSMQARIP